MKINTKKRQYSKHIIEQIKIDKNISMVMMSNPPDDPPILPEGLPGGGGDPTGLLKIFR